MQVVFLSVGPLASFVGLFMVMIYAVGDTRTLRQQNITRFNEAVEVCDWVARCLLTVEYCTIT